MTFTLKNIKGILSYQHQILWPKIEKRSILHFCSIEDNPSILSPSYSIKVSFIFWSWLVRKRRIIKVAFLPNSSVSIDPVLRQMVLLVGGNLHIDSLGLSRDTGMVTSDAEHYHTADYCCHGGMHLAWGQDSRPPTCGYSGISDILHVCAR